VAAEKMALFSCVRYTTTKISNTHRKLVIFGFNGAEEESESVVGCLSFGEVVVVCESRKNSITAGRLGLEQMVRYVHDKCFIASTRRSSSSLR
jgi:hypothetical protein